MDSTIVVDRVYNRNGLLIFCLIFQFLSPLVWAGDSEQILEYLGSGDFTGLRKMREVAMGVDSLFLEALFEVDGGKAADAFKKIWEEHPDHLLAWEALQRLYEFYVVQGNDDRALELRRLLQDRPHDSIPPAGKIEFSGGFWVQTGAFSNANNAINQRDRLVQMGFKAVIVEKMVRGKRLNVVRAGSFPSEAEARQAASRIQKKLKIHPRVVSGD